MNSMRGWMSTPQGLLCSVSGTKPRRSSSSKRVERHDAVESRRIDGVGHHGEMLQRGNRIDAAYRRT